KGFLGLTVSCARCHDHMFDPIPTKDYYALHGVFASTVEPADKPVIRQADPFKAADFAQKLAVLEQKNRDAYYRIAGRTLNEFQGNAKNYLLALQFGGRRKLPAEQQKARAAM